FSCIKRLIESARCAAMSQQPTRVLLIRAALRLFGRQGYEAASTRAIAAEAGTNISSIAYHFGGKEGLRLACADAVADQIEQIARALPVAPADLDRRRARLALR